jgi:hypothetical protein
MARQVSKPPQKRKWSAKRKRKINCKRPKGFSEKAHCAAKKGEVVKGKPLKVCLKCKKKEWMCSCWKLSRRY